MTDKDWLVVNEVEKIAKNINSMIVWAGIVNDMVNNPNVSAEKMKTAMVAFNDAAKFVESKLGCSVTSHYPIR